MISWYDILLRLSLAAVLGGLVGVERERKNWAAGLRTHMMVCVGAALTMMVSAFGFRDILGAADVVLDPSRIAAQVISGIGFIGAGTILFLRQEVIRGLTTAAGLWTVAAVGLAVGGGMYYAASMATVIVLVILWLLKPLERRLFRKYRVHSIRIDTEPDAVAGFMTALHEKLSTERIDVYSITVEKDIAATHIQLRLRNKEDTSHAAALIGWIQSFSGVRQVDWEKDS